MTTPPEIRLLTPADAAVFRDIRLDGLRQNPHAFLATFEDENAMPISRFEERTLTSSVFGAYVDGELLGVAGYRRQDGAKESHKAILWGMYVRPKGRHRRLGEALMQAIVAHASGSVEQLKLVVTASNEPAFRLYQKLGFSEYGRETRALKHDGRYFDDILMVRFLASG
ncbi:MAG TPA: GNAT family N-acetyltransferase [Bradyrhizobium sp.]|nr:GNAT family N-acetyltransferase [Bradyrhizobium sp.]